MRQEVIDELTRRIDELRPLCKPWEVRHGMTGSGVEFAWSLQVHTAMTEEEWKTDVYRPWIREQHRKMLDDINKGIPDPFLE